MIDKEYNIKINAPKEFVWDTMIGTNTYPKWIKGFSENSQIIGEWVQGTKVDFIDPNMGGTRALLEIVDKPNRILAKHIAMLSKDRKPEERAEKWVGTLEEYILTEDEGVTTLTIKMHLHPDFEEMLSSGWKVSLKLLKELCEQQNK